MIISNFVYTMDKSGNRRGWGVAEYSTPERFMGEAFSEQVYKRSPEESCERLLDYLHHLFPQLPEQAIKKFLR